VRHYRTVWALFMLGKIALKSGDPEAVTWFQKTREAAKLGFADSLGMAADSYGWEGRSEWKQNHPEKAAELFLTQFALGDTSAIVSLKALIPDRAPVEGMLSYGMEAEDYNKLTPEQKSAEDQKAQTALGAAAKDPLHTGNNVHHASLRLISYQGEGDRRCRDSLPIAMANPLSGFRLDQGAQLAETLSLVKRGPLTLPLIAMIWNIH
jgi:hypothetical protein